jgi:cell shape-determining protein MreC
MTTVIVILSVLLLVTVYYVIRFGLIIARIEEGIEDALEVLDGSYAAIGKILEKPLFFDSAEVRSVLNELGRAQKAILVAASSMSAELQPIEEEEED